jgi:hypothetical protein
LGTFKIALIHSFNALFFMVVLIGAAYIFSASSAPLRANYMLSQQRPAPGLAQALAPQKKYNQSFAHFYSIWV